MGRQFPGTNTVVDGKTGRENIDGERKESGKLNPIILGNEIVTVEDNRMKGGGGYAGSDITAISGFNSKTGGQVPKDKMAANNNLGIGLTDVIEHGLQVGDPKRRRVSETNGLTVENTQLDITMLDSQDINIQNKKNELEAGAARQARQEL
ncbi:hypothetical protein AgCh_015779 [Apium graveolens]